MQKRRTACEKTKLQTDRESLMTSCTNLDHKNQELIGEKEELNDGKSKFGKEPSRDDLGYVRMGNGDKR